MFTSITQESALHPNLNKGSAYLQVEALGVLSGVLASARSHWSSSSSSSSSVGPPSATRQQQHCSVTVGAQHRKPETGPMREAHL